MQQYCDILYARDVISALSWSQDFQLLKWSGLGQVCSEAFWKVDLIVFSVCLGLVFFFSFFFFFGEKVSGPNLSQ